MGINYPDSPTNAQEHTDANGTVWVFTTGLGWARKAVDVTLPDPLTVLEIAEDFVAPDSATSGGEWNWGGYEGATAPSTASDYEVDNSMVFTKTGNVSYTGNGAHIFCSASSGYGNQGVYSNTGIGQGAALEWSIDSDSGDYVDNFSGVLGLNTNASADHNVTGIDYGIRLRCVGSKTSYANWKIGVIINGTLVTMNKMGTTEVAQPDLGDTSLKVLYLGDKVFFYCGGTLLHVEEGVATNLDLKFDAAFATMFAALSVTFGQYRAKISDGPNHPGILRCKAAPGVYYGAQIYLSDTSHFAVTEVVDFVFKTPAAPAESDVTLMGWFNIDSIRHMINEESVNGLGVFIGPGDLQMKWATLNRLSGAELVDDIYMLSPSTWYRLRQQVAPGGDFGIQLFSDVGVLLSETQLVLGVNYYEMPSHSVSTIDLQGLSVQPGIHTFTVDANTGRVLLDIDRVSWSAIDLQRGTS